MSELIATVYLNTADASFLGFNRISPARLAAAAGFALPVDGPVTEAATKAALETIFEQLNIDEPTAPWAIKYRLARHRSLSVGDVVALGETAWACASVGWDRVTTDDLRAALAR